MLADFDAWSKTALTRRKTFFAGLYFATLAEILGRVVLEILLPSTIKLRVLTKSRAPCGVDGSAHMRIREAITSKDALGFVRKTR